MAFTGITVNQLIKELNELKKKGEIKGSDLVAMSRDSEGNGFSLLDSSFYSTGFMPKEYGPNKVHTEEDYNSDCAAEDDYEEDDCDEIDDDSFKYNSFEDYLKDQGKELFPVVVLWGTY